MPDRKQSPGAVPQEESGRPNPDTQRDAIDGHSDASGRDKGTARTSEPGRQDYHRDGPGKIGPTSDRQPDLVAPSGVNQRDHGVADDKPMAGGSVNFDDDDMVHPRGKTTAAGGTRDAEGGDSAPLGPPGAGLSDRIGPSDPDSKKQ